MPCRFLRPSGIALLLALTVPLCVLPAQGRTGRIRGVVVDSLLGATLPGAEVRVARLNRTAMTDSTGRFVLDSMPPGEWIVAFRHPSLDSIKIIDPGTSVRVFAGAGASVTLATPAFEAIRDRLCAQTPDSLSPTVAFGSVHATEGARVRINVSVSWLASTPGGEARPGSVRTGEEGESQVWVACGIPRSAWFHATVSDSTRSASAFLQMGARDVAVRDLVLSSRVGPLAGTVRDTSGRPIGAARVSLVGTDIAAESDASGSFVLPDVPGSTVTVDVRAAGYRPSLTALPGGLGRVDLRLVPLREPEVRPPGGSDYLRLLMRSTRAGMALLTEPGLSTDSTALARQVPAGTCRWWLDGRPVERDFFLAQPRWSWRALELYARGPDAPPEYRAPDCPVALLWTAMADW